MSLELKLPRSVAIQIKKSIEIRFLEQMLLELMSLEEMPLKLI
jgi:hypothetical protein